MQILWISGNFIENRSFKCNQFLYVFYNSQVLIIIFLIVCVCVCACVRACVRVSDCVSHKCEIFKALYKPLFQSALKLSFLRKLCIAKKMFSGINVYVINVQGFRIVRFYSYFSLQILKRRQKVSHLNVATPYGLVQVYMQASFLHALEALETSVTKVI